jgi:acetyl-CoA synthetase
MERIVSRSSGVIVTPSRLSSSLAGMMPAGVALKPGFQPSTEMEGKVSKLIDTEIGKIARPKNVWIVPDMPKTRSGKIIRRVIASISNFADVGDVTTLANPEIVEDIRHTTCKSAKVAKDDVPRQLTEAEFEEMNKFGNE